MRIRLSGRFVRSVNTSKPLHLQTDHFICSGLIHEPERKRCQSCRISLVSGFLYIHFRECFEGYFSSWQFNLAKKKNAIRRIWKRRQFVGLLHFVETMNIIRLYDRLNSLSMREKHNNKFVSKDITKITCNLRRRQISPFFALSLVESFTVNDNVWSEFRAVARRSISMHESPEYEFELYSLFFQFFVHVSFNFFQNWISA